MDTSKTIRFARTKPGFTIYRLIAVLIGLTIFFALNETAGLIILILVALASLSSAGKEIHPANKQMRDYWSLGPINIGKWKPLPHIEYVAAVRMIKGKKQFHASSFSVEQVPSNEFIYQLNLVINPNKNDVLKITSGERVHILEKAIYVGKALDLKVLDFTTPQHKWIS